MLGNVDFGLYMAEKIVVSGENCLFKLDEECEVLNREEKQLNTNEIKPEDKG